MKIYVKFLKFSDRNIEDLIMIEVIDLSIYFMNWSIWLIDTYKYRDKLIFSGKLSYIYSGVKNVFLVWKWIWVWF